MTNRTRTRTPSLPTQEPPAEVVDLDAPPAEFTETADAPPVDADLDLDPSRIDPRRIPDRFVPDRIRILGVSGTYIRRPWVLSPTAEDSAPEFTPNPEEPVVPGRFPTPGEIPQRLPGRIPIDIHPIIRHSEDLRVDVDGYYPQMVISGTITRGMVRRCDWFARVSRTASGSYAGPIAYRNGDATLLPQSQVDVALVRRTMFGGGGSATATFSGGGAPTSARRFTFSTASFHPVQFEYDCTSDSGAVTTFATGTHPNRPADLPVETVSIESVFRRAGFAVTKSGGDSIVPIAAAGSDALWTDQELNDAMATYWSAYSSSPAWAAWALFAGQSIRGSSLGGIMFDYTAGTAPQRQGCVVFSNSFISNVPSGDPNGPAWVRRMRFWTAVHELGHAFNLSHAWDKPSGSWIPTPSEKHLRSFMNYPHSFSPGAATGFFSEFRHRFSDSELVFMRHAPERFVRMGDAAWFTNHGFSQAETVPGSPLVLHLRAHRESMTYEFLEPVTLELKLQNAGTEPIIIDAGALDLANCSVVVQRRGQDARQLVPYAVKCLKPQPTALQPGESLYGSVTVSSGREGWILAEPGDHVVQVAVHLPDEDVVTAPVRVRVRPPVDRQEEVIAQDVLTPEVGRVLAAGGTRRSSPEADALREAAERLPDRAIAAHSRMALGRPLTGPGKQLVVTQGADGRPHAQEVTVLGAEPEAAVAEMAPALQDIDAAAETFGHIAARKRVETYARALADAGRVNEAVDVEGSLHDVLSRRGVKAQVLAQIAEQRDEFRARH